VVRIVSQDVFKCPDDDLMSGKLGSRWLRPAELGGALLRVGILLADPGILGSTLDDLERCGSTGKDSVRTRLGRVETVSGHAWDASRVQFPPRMPLSSPRTFGCLLLPL
jgi:hypothetical protein